MNMLRAFVAGYLSTLIFHQGVYAILSVAVGTPTIAWDMSPTEPFGVRATISLAFFGGLWGIVLWWLIAHHHRVTYWVRSILIGAIGPSAVALLIVFPLKDLPILGGPDPKIIGGALILNATWGFGVALLLYTMKRV